MPYDPGAQGVTLHSDELVAPDEERQIDASSELPDPPLHAIASWRGGGMGDGAASCLARATARRALAG